MENNNTPFMLENGCCRLGDNSSIAIVFNRQRRGPPLIGAVVLKVPNAE